MEHIFAAPFIKRRTSLLAVLVLSTMLVGTPATANEPGLGVFEGHEHVG